MSNVVRYWKDPVYRMNNKEMDVEHPSGNIMDELDNQDMLMIAGAGPGCKWYNLSCHFGNVGKICTITVECQHNCRLGKV